jgi:hypothetical protein
MRFFPQKNLLNKLAKFVGFTAEHPECMHIYKWERGEIQRKMLHAYKWMYDTSFVCPQV